MNAQHAWNHDCLAPGLSDAPFLFYILPGKIRLHVLNQTVMMKPKKYRLVQNTITCSRDCPNCLKWFWLRDLNVHSIKPEIPWKPHMDMYFVFRILSPVCVSFSDGALLFGSQEHYPQLTFSFCPPSLQWSDDENTATLTVRVVAVPGLPGAVPWGASGFQRRSL